MLFDPTTAIAQTTTEAASPSAAADPLEQATPDHPIDPELSLQLEECNHLSERRVAEILTLELSTLGRAAHPGPIEVRLACSDTSMTISARLDDATALDRQTLGDPREMQERATALTASELVAELWSAQTPPRSEEADEAPLAQQPARNDAARPNEVSLLGGLRWLQTPERFEGGLQVMLLHEVSQRRTSRGVRWSLGASVGGFYGTMDSSELKVEQTTTAIAPELRLTFPLGKTSMGLGASVPIGWVWMTPHSKIEGAEETPLSAPWSAVLGHLDFRVPATSRWHAVTGLSMGVVTLPVRGDVDGTTVIALEGLLLSAQAGVGCSF